MNHKKCIIVIPTHKFEPDDLEQLSLKQLDKVIKGDIDICIVRPKNINIDAYNKLFKNSKPSTIILDDKYFTSFLGYNQMCLDYDFYKPFEDYEYMMIYQTDCWIFRNDIQKFCDMGYDYIGGPIYSAGSKWPSFQYSAYPKVGNGGLSLRKISKMLKLFDRNGYIYNKHKDEWAKQEYEDMFLCDVIAREIYINIPDYKIAEQFSIDSVPFHISTLSPMACHRVFAMYKYWKTVIPELNDEHIVELSNIAAENFKKMYS